MVFIISIAINVRSHGQVVKTSPFHGGNRGSIPLGTASVQKLGQINDIWRTVIILVHVTIQLQVESTQA